MRKGVSAVIATILMLVITIALAGLTFSYLTTTFKTQTGKVIDIISLDCTGTTISAVLRNAGTDPLVIASDLTATVNGVSATLGTCTGTIAATKVTTCTLTGIASSSNSVKIISPSNVASGNALCP